MTIGDESVVLEVGGKKIARWENYSFNNHFLIPADGFSFSIGGDSLTPDLIKMLKPGLAVKLTIDGNVQASGFIDRIVPRTNRSGGGTITVEGRDKFGSVLDSQIDPRKKWKDTTLEKFIIDTLGPFGFTTFFVDNEANTNVAAGKAVKRNKKPKKLSEYKSSYAKPQNNECVFSFVSRITQHLGLWIWPTVDGDGVVVGVPDFAQKARYRIVMRMRGGSQNTALEGGVTRDYTGQPSFIVGRGRIPGKTFERTKTSVTLTSNLAASGTQTPALKAVGESPFIDHLGYQIEKETVVVPAKPVEWANEFASTVARPIFLTDDHSKDIEELKKFVQREMSLRTRHAVTGHYIVAGHTQNDVPWTIDSICDVSDEVSDWERPMWILSRTFRKDRSSGTTTELELLPLDSLVF
ncbi:MAG: hypothetical protein WC551_07680 [Patescibacteria group bacterium]